VAPAECHDQPAYRRHHRNEVVRLADCVIEEFEAWRAGRPLRYEVTRTSSNMVERMAYWLLKTEAEEFLLGHAGEKGRQGEPWNGVRNFTARRHMTEMKKGERAFFYHTVTRSRSWASSK